LIYELLIIKKPTAKGQVLIMVVPTEPIHLAHLLVQQVK